MGPRSVSPTAPATEVGAEEMPRTRGSSSTMTTFDDSSCPLTEHLDWLRVRNAEQRVLQISLVVGGLIAWWFLSHHNQFAGMLFLFLTLSNFSSLQQLLSDEYYVTRFKAMLRH